MKLNTVLKAIAPFLASDKKIEDVQAAVLAANDGMPGNVASSKEIEDKRAKDRKARDEKRAEDRKARDKARDEARKAEDAKRAADRKARDEKCAEDRKARDEKFGEDRDDDPEHTNDADVLKACDADMDEEKKAEDEAEEKAEDEDYTQGADPSTPGGSRAGGKTAVDSAEVDARIAAAVKAERERGAALRVALDEVAPILGKVTFDSAPAAYRAALTQMKVDHKGVPDAGLQAVLKIATDRARSPVAPVRAADAATVSAMDSLIPGYSRLK